MNSLSIFGNRLGARLVVSPPVIDSVRPALAAAGTTIVLRGANFTDVSAMNFGMAAVRSYTVVSPTTSAAVVDTSTSDRITVTTPAGVAAIGGFRFVSTPGIGVVGSFALLLSAASGASWKASDSGAAYQ